MRFARTSVIAAAVALTPLAAQAKPQWHTVYAAAGITVSLDSSRIAKNSDGSYTVWTRWDYSQPRALENKKLYSQLVEKATVKCAPIVMKRVSTELFDRNGNVMKPLEEARESEVRVMSWDAPRKGSDSEKAWTAVCAELAARK